jgi:hypothetical protein
MPTAPPPTSATTARSAVPGRHDPGLPASCRPGPNADPLRPARGDSRRPDPRPTTVRTTGSPPQAKGQRLHQRTGPSARRARRVNGNSGQRSSPAPSDAHPQRNTEPSDRCDNRRTKVRTCAPRRTADSAPRLPTSPVTQRESDVEPAVAPADSARVSLPPRGWPAALRLSVRRGRVLPGAGDRDAGWLSFSGATEMLPETKGGQHAG